MSSGKSEKHFRTCRQMVDEVGVDRIVERASRTMRPVGTEAALKWRLFGIPDWHWDIFIDLIKATPEEIFEANREARSKVLRFRVSRRPMPAARKGKGGSTSRRVKTAA